MLVAGRGGAEVQTVLGAWLDGSGNTVLWRNGQIRGGRGEDAGKQLLCESKSLVPPDHSRACRKSPSTQGQLLKQN